MSHTSKKNHSHQGRGNHNNDNYNGIETTTEEMSRKYSQLDKKICEAKERVKKAIRWGLF